MPPEGNTTKNEQSSTKERLLKYIESKHLNANQFLEMSGLSKTYISNMRQSIKPSTFDNNIAPAFPDLNKSWLLYGDGEMLNNTIDSIEVKKISKKIKDLPHGDQMELLNKKLDYLMKSEELNRVYLKTLLAFHDIKIDMFESRENELDQIKKTVN